jgi:hypothetical protein
MFKNIKSMKEMKYYFDSIMEIRILLKFQMFLPLLYRHTHPQKQEFQKWLHPIHAGWHGGGGGGGGHH